LESPTPNAEVLTLVLATPARPYSSTVSPSMTLGLTKAPSMLSTSPVAEAGPMRTESSFRPVAAWPSMARCGASSTPTMARAAVGLTLASKPRLSCLRLNWL